MGNRFWIDILRIGRQYFYKTKEGEKKITFHLKKGDKTYDYNLSKIQGFQDITFLRIPSPDKVYGAVYTEKDNEILIPMMSEVVTEIDQEATEAEKDPRVTKKAKTVAEWIEEQPRRKRTGPMIAAKLQQGNSNSVYYLENREEKRRGDINLKINNEEINLTKIKRISGTVQPRHLGQ